MGRIRPLQGGAEQELRRSHLVGRAAGCHLELPQAYVSLQHACLRWTEIGWELKDLGSLNGCFVNGAKVDSMRLHEGDRIWFGREEQAWDVVDVDPPKVMAVPQDGGAPVFVEAGILAIPDPEDPRASIYRNSRGVWTLEHSDDLVALVDQQSFTLEGISWTFHSPDAVVATSTADEQESRRILDATLHFKVSPDEEHVELSVESAGRSIDLGSRAHHYLLLILARQKLLDVTRAFPPPVCGWVYQDELTRGLQISPAQLNVDIFRIRKQFGNLGIVDAGNIVQRRPRTKQLRIGTQNITETQV